MKKYQVVLRTGEITGPFDSINLDELSPDAIRVEELALLPTGQFWSRGFQSAPPEQDEEQTKDDCSVLSTWEEILAYLPPETIAFNEYISRYNYRERHITLTHDAKNLVNIERFCDNDSDQYSKVQSPISRAELAEIIRWVRRG